MAKSFKDAIKPPAAAGFISAKEPEPEEPNEMKELTELFNKTPEEIIKKFKAAMKAEERNKLTSGPKSKRLNLVTWPALVKAAQERAAAEGKNLTKYIEDLIIKDIETNKDKEF